MKKLIIGVVMISLIISCKPKGETETLMKEVEVESMGNYRFKKIYVEDKLGRTHEILTSSSGNTMGGVGMLELCVYGGTEEAN